MKRKTKTTTTTTALQTFEARKASIASKAKKLAQLLEEYDRAISSKAGGHQDWSHAGTLGNVETLLDQAIESLVDASTRTTARNAFRF